jgi:hypothetical protein
MATAKSLGRDQFKFETVTRARLTDSGIVVELGLQNLVVFQQPVSKSSSSHGPPHVLVQPSDVLLKLVDLAGGLPSFSRKNQFSIWSFSASSLEVQAAFL